MPRTLPCLPGNVKRRGVQGTCPHPGYEQREPLFRVSASLKEPETLRREPGALEKAMEELILGDSAAITLYEKERIKTPAGTVEVIPAWEWFLAPCPPAAG